MPGDLNQLLIKHEVLAGQGAVNVVAGNVSAPSRKEYAEKRHFGDQQPAAINRNAEETSSELVKEL